MLKVFKNKKYLFTVHNKWLHLSGAKFARKSYVTEIIVCGDTGGTSRELCHGLNPRTVEGRPPSAHLSLLNTVVPHSVQKIPLVANLPKEEGT